MKSYKIAVGAALLTIAAGTAYATTQTVQISTVMRVGITFSNVVNMSFIPVSGHIDFNGTPAAATDYVTMGGDGGRAVVGTKFQLSPTGNGIPGSLTIVGDGASGVDITCSTGATMASASSPTIVLGVDQLQVSFHTATAYQAATNGTTTICGGVGTGAKAVTLTGSGDDVFIGGRLDGDNTVITDGYSTANTGGTPMTVQVVYN